MLPQVVAFNQSNVFSTGVSGGSLTLSGFFVPAHLASFASPGVLLMCGGLTPQVDFVGADQVASSTRIHFQSTQKELALLQPELPQAVAAYEQLAVSAGLNTAQINALQTFDNTPDGGHCEFDGQAFSSGIQRVFNNFATIMQGGHGSVNGINATTVLNGVAGGSISFSGSS